MDIPGTVRSRLTPATPSTCRALLLIHEFADPGDIHPIATVIDQIRATEVVLGER